ncbi:MAG: hypothetical protein KDC86_13670 [Saprospiraceae bacterium]|nr:hypothetical protein [Saprospiraceae bacterium]
MKKLIISCVLLILGFQVFSQKIIYSKSDRENEFVFKQEGFDIVAYYGVKGGVLDTVFRYPSASHTNVRIIDAYYEDSIFVCIYQFVNFLAFTNHSKTSHGFVPLFGGFLRTLTVEAARDFSLKIINSTKVEYIENDIKYYFIFDNENKTVQLIEE